MLISSRLVRVLLTGLAITGCPLLMLAVTQPGCRTVESADAARRNAGPRWPSYENEAWEKQRRELNAREQAEMGKTGEKRR